MTLKDRAKKFTKYSELRKELFSKKEIQELNTEVELEASSIRDMQEAISKEIIAYMAKEGIGFNEFTRRLGTSSRQTSKVIKGEANLTIVTIAEIASVMGKRPKIRFE